MVQKSRDNNYISKNGKLNSVTSVACQKIFNWKKTKNGFEN